MVKTKRNNDSHIEAKEPLSKFPMVDICPENMKKPDLFYCKQLENINEKLQNENSKLVKMIEDNKDTIKNLEKSVKVLELKNQVLNQQEEKF